MAAFPNFSHGGRAWYIFRWMFCTHREKNGHRWARSFPFAVIPTAAEGSRAARRDFSAFSTLRVSPLGLTRSTRVIFFCRNYRAATLDRSRLRLGRCPGLDQPQYTILAGKPGGRGRGCARTRAERGRRLRRYRVLQRLAIMHPLKVLLMVQSCRQAIAPGGARSLRCGRDDRKKGRDDSRGGRGADMTESRLRA